ncbi:MAG: hypothetical protein PHT07_01205 [Paludibacter sp.]|nr:hypothetical protein [Paludibacter sp.]
MGTILDTKANTAVVAHINMQQGIINRMAANSASCKTLTITILAAILVLLADKKLCICNMWIAYIPVALFFFLDCFYLGLERGFTKKQAELIAKINNGTDISKDIFLVKDKSGDKFWVVIWATIKKFFKQLINTLGAIISFSTLPFYGSIICFIYFLTKM